MFILYSFNLNVYRHCVCLTALQVLQKSSQLWKEVQLDQEEPQCPSGQEQLALQTGTDLEEVQSM